MNKKTLRQKRARYSKIAWLIAWILLIAVIASTTVVLCEADKPRMFVLSCSLTLLAFFAGMNDLIDDNSSEQSSGQ